MMKTKDFIYIALFTVFAVVLSIIENFIPLSFSIPGLRIGLANIAVLAVLYLYSFKYAVFIIIIKNLLVFLKFGNIIAFLMSMTGGLLSVIFMYIFKRYFDKYFSIYGVSAVGAFFHNFGQILCASILLSNKVIFGYLPILVIIGTFTSILIAKIAELFINRFKNIRGFINE